VYILDFDPESRLEILEEKIEKGGDITHAKSVLKSILKNAKEGLKSGLIIDKRLTQVIEDRILRMEVYLAAIL
jgi:hypothetical protein